MSVSPPAHRGDRASTSHLVVPTSGVTARTFPATLGAAGTGQLGGNGGCGPAALPTPCRFALPHLPRPPLRVTKPPSVRLAHLTLDLPGAVGVRLAQRGPIALVVPVEILAPALD